jgi:hypothetical protein
MVPGAVKARWSTGSEGASMRGRQLLLLGVAAALLLAACLALWLAARPARVSRARFEAVRAGMTVEEVEAALGGPPGDYRTGEVKLDLSGGQPEFDNAMLAPEVLLGERHFRHEWWQGDEGNAWVCFDEDRRVVTKEFTPGERVASTPLDRLRRWLGR